MRVSPLVIPYLAVGLMLVNLIDEHIQLRCHPPLGPVRAIVLAVAWPVTLTIMSLGTSKDACKKEASN